MPQWVWQLNLPSIEKTFSVSVYSLKNDCLLKGQRNSRFWSNEAIISWSGKQKVASLLSQFLGFFFPVGLAVYELDQNLYVFTPVF